MVQKTTKEQLTVPAHIDYLADLRDFVAQMGKKHRLEDKLVKAFKLAIDEAATNIIQYAYRDFEESGKITIRVFVRRNAVTFSIIDQGKYFDPKRIQEPDLERYVAIGKRGGLGIFIMRKLMDEVEYHKTEEGNELRLTKYRAMFEKGRVASFFSKRFAAIPLGLKTKFWSITAGFILATIGIVYLYYYVVISINIFNQHVAQWENISAQVVRNLVDQSQIFEDLTGASQNVLLRSHLFGHDAEVFEISVVDSNQLVIGHSSLEKTFTRFELPASTFIRHVRPNVLLYIVSTAAQRSPFEVYDYVRPVTLADDARPIGELHLRVYKSYIDRLIRAKRWDFGRLALLAAAVGCAGSFLLIYLLLNPLRKLAEWVRSAGHGYIHDEIDIDPSSEVGEIAKAFSEITTKFRESQKNLAEQERLQKEMQVAQEIQQTLLPKEFPDIEGYEIAGHYEAAQLIGGDYYDFVEVDRDTIGIVVADVSGKGVPGSMIMTMIRQALRTEARGVKDAAEVLTRLNDLVMGDMRKGMFVTIFYVIIDSRRRRLNYASAGHNPMVLYRATAQKTYYLNPHGFPIGIQLPDSSLFRRSIESDTIQLAEEDLLLLYTDGITEAMNGSRSIFGEERLLSVIRKNGQLRAKPFVDELCNEILSFTEGSPQSDDITFVCIREKSSQTKEELRRAKAAYLASAAGKPIRQACDEAGISTATYYAKYKEAFETEGLENFEVQENNTIESKHIAIEDKALIFDIIRQHPEYGAKRISDELKTARYRYTDISEAIIYQELVRMRLNTRQLREAFINRGGRRHGPPMKPPGTPMLTLDGRVIIDRKIMQQRPLPDFDREPAALPGSQPLVHSAQSPAAPATSPPPVEQAAGEEERIAVPADAEAIIPESSPPEPPPEVVQEQEAPEVMDEETGEISPVAPEEATPSSSYLIEDDFSALIGDESPVAGSEHTAAPLPPEEEELPAERLEEKTDAEKWEDLAFLSSSFFGLDFTPADKEQSSEIMLEGDEDGEATPAPDAEKATAPGEEDAEKAVPIAGVDEFMNNDRLPLSELQQGGTSALDAAAGEASDDGSGEAASPSHSAETAGSRRPPTQTTKSMDLREELLVEGFRLYNLKKFHEAINQFRKIVKLFPDFREAYRILGNAYARIDDFERASETYSRIKELDPTDVFAYENLGLVYSKQGRYEEAIKEWRQLMLLDPGRKDIQKRIDYFAQKLNEPQAP